MSASSEVLTPILLRSSTPAPSEKVLLYLEGIARSGGASPVRDSMFTDSGFDPNDPQLAKLNAYRNSGHRSSRLSQSYKAGENELEEHAHSEMSYEKVDHDEFASNIQEGERSEVAKSVAGQEHQEYQDHNEPGPEDGPGPKYESYGSSFGNLGPLPRDSYDPSHPQPSWTANGTPTRPANGNLPPEPDSPRSQHRAPWGQHILRPTSRNAMSPPPPPPPGPSDVNINVEPPTDLSQTYDSRMQSHVPSYASPNGRQSSMANRSEAASATADPPMGGITVSIGPDGSTTISIPRGGANRTPTDVAQSERAPTETGDDPRFRAMSPRLRTERQAASIVGSRRPPADDESLSLLSPEAQARNLRSPNMPARATGVNRASHMNSVDAYKPYNDFQSFGATQAQDYIQQHMTPVMRAMQQSQGTPVMRTAHQSQASPAVKSMHQLQGTPLMKPMSSKAQSYRPPSEPATIPNEITGNGGFAHTERTRDATSYAGPSEAGVYRVDENVNGYARPRQRVRSISGTSRGGTSQPAPVPRDHGRMDSMDARQGRSRALSPVISQPNTLRTDAEDALQTPPQVRPPTPEEELNDYETEIVQGILSARTPRTSVAPSLLAEELKRTHYHDEDLCILLHAAEDEMQHDVVRRALRKAVAARIRKLGLKSDRESIKEYRKKFHDHDPSWHANHVPSFNPDDPPSWVKDMMGKLQAMESRVAEIGPQLAKLKQSESSRTRTRSHSHRNRDYPETQDDYERTPRTTTMGMGTQMTGTMGDDSAYRRPETEYTAPGQSMHHHDGSTHGLMTDGDEFEDADTQGPHGRAYTSRTLQTQDTEYLPPHKRADLFSASGRGESPGQQVLEEELYRLRAKEQSRSGPMTHQSWVLSADGSVGGEQETQQPEEEVPDIEEDQHRPETPQLAALPTDHQGAAGLQSQGEQVWQQGYSDQPPVPPWQRIHQRLLNWAIVWPMAELDAALASTQRSFQVDEVALSIWSTQMYKRYVRQQLTEIPPGRVDRLFVPPNMADAINNAVFHGRHGDACGMLRDLWTPFGLDGMPRIIVVLCKHRSDSDHWVAHKFSLPDGTLSTYDTYPEKCLPDGRPLGWWFAIRIAWPGALYPSPDHLMQKMVRLHRPNQLDTDNAVAAAGIWRNLLMGSRAERPVDLERLRDLIQTEVKNLRQRKEQGKLSVAAANRQNWNWQELGN